MGQIAIFEKFPRVFGLGGFVSSKGKLGSQTKGMLQQREFTEEVGASQ